MSDISTFQVIPMAEATISTSESAINEPPTSTSEKCKKPKIADTTTTTTGDFISGLPDAVLCHILSYIPTRDAVAAGVLSKRWNRVWTSVPNLDFSDWSRSISESPINYTSFMNFVDNVLSLNNVSCVRKIDLFCCDDCDSSRVNSWLDGIVSRDAEEFHLTLPRWCEIQNLDQISRIYSLPSSFFTSKYLVELWLERIALKVSTAVHYPNVKTISFTYVQFLDDDTMKNILSGCPVIWRLIIERGTWDNAQTLYISSSTLRILSLHTEYCDIKNSGYKVIIEAPNVSSLDLTDFDFGDADYEINDLSSLVKADIYVEQDDRASLDFDVFEHRLFQFLRKISHIEDLCLAHVTMHSFEDASLENLPMFNNLTCLKVELYNDDSWPILPYLFHCMPNLVTFVLHKDFVHPGCCWYEPIEVPKCFLSCLEKIEIESFEDCDALMEMVYYFLKNAMVLKKLVIDSFNLDLETETKILKLLLTFPRSSSICHVEYRN